MEAHRKKKEEMAERHRKLIEEAAQQLTDSSEGENEDEDESEEEGPVAIIEKRIKEEGRGKLHAPKLMLAKGPPSSQSAKVAQSLKEKMVRTPPNSWCWFVVCGSSHPRRRGIPV